MKNIHMNRKNMLWLTAILSSMLMLGSCSGSSETAETEAAETQAEEIVQEITTEEVVTEAETFLCGYAFSQETNEAIAGATVTIQSLTTGADISVVTTDMDGFWLARVPLDDYRIRINHEEYEELVSEITADAMDSLKEMGQSQLKVSAENDSAAAAASENARILMTGTVYLEAAKPVYPLEDQIRVMVDNYGLWDKALDWYDLYDGSYSISDLDQDGLLEIRNQVSYGNGGFMYWKAYEVSENLDGLIPISGFAYGDEGMAYDVPTDFNNIFAEFSSETEYRGYYDEDRDIWKYLVRDSWRSGWAENGFVIYEMSMVNDQVSYVELGSYEVFRDNQQNETITYKVNGNTYGSESEFLAAMQESYDRYSSFTYRSPSIYSTDVTDLYTDLLNLANEYLEAFQEPEGVRGGSTAAETEAPANVSSTEAAEPDTSDLPKQRSTN